MNKKRHVKELLVAEVSRCSKKPASRRGELKNKNIAEKK